MPALNKPNSISPIEGLNLVNNETYTAFKKMLESVMVIVKRIKDPRYGVKPEMTILQFVNRYNIECAKNTLESIDAQNPENSLCLQHIQHLYEIIEQTQLMKLMEYIKLERPNVNRNDLRIQNLIEECPHQVNATYHLKLTDDHK